VITVSPVRSSALLILVLITAGCSAVGRTPSRDSVVAAQLARTELGGVIEVSDFPGAGPRVYIIGSIHGDEPEGRGAEREVVAALREDRGASVRFVHDMNPDGSRAGTRVNAAGVDLNRNWPAVNFRAGRGTGAAPLSERETEAVYADIARYDPDVIMVFHSARNGPFVNFDGGPSARDLAQVFVDAARGAGDDRWRVVADMGYPTPGSMGTYFGKERGRTILTIELRRGDEPSRVPGPLVAGILAVTNDPALARAGGAKGCNQAAGPE
jgi:protein MpaA